MPTSFTPQELNAGKELPDKNGILYRILANRSLEGPENVDANGLKWLGPTQITFEQLTGISVNSDETLITVPPIVALCLGNSINQAGQIIFPPTYVGDVFYFFNDGKAAGSPFNPVVPNSNLPLVVDLDITNPSSAPPHDFDSNFYLEIGKVYRTRNGLKVKIVETVGNYKFKAEVIPGTYWGGYKSDKSYTPGDVVLYMHADPSFLTGLEPRLYMAITTMYGTKEKPNPTITQENYWVRLHGTLWGNEVISEVNLGKYKGKSISFSSHPTYEVWYTGRVGDARLPKDIIQPWIERNLWKYVFADPTNCLDKTKWSSLMDTRPSRPWPAGKSLFQIHMKELKNRDQRYSLERDN